MAEHKTTELSPIEVMNSLLVRMETDIEEIKSGALEPAEIRGVNATRKAQVSYIAEVLKAKRLMRLQKDGIFSTILDGNKGDKEK